MKVVVGETQHGYKHTEIGSIPVDWEISTVGREFSVQLGKMLDAAKNAGVAKPYLGNRAVQWDQIDVSDLPVVPMSRDDLDRFRLEIGDLLVCEGGEVGRAAIWHAPIAECYYQKALHRLRPLSGFDVRLMAAILRRWSERGLLANYVTQTSIAHLPREKFLEVPIPRPPVREQQAIAAALSDVDALLAGLDRLIAKKRDLKQAAIQQLLTGQTRLPGFGGNWNLRKLGEDIADLLAGVSVNSIVDDADAMTCGPAVLKTSAVGNGEFKPWEAKTIATADIHRVQLTPEAETVLISRMNTIDLVGECGYVNADHPGLFVPDRLWMTRFRNGAQMSARWLASLLSTPLARLLIKNIATGTSGSMKNISKAAFLNLEFKVPELDEQIAISVALADMRREIALLEVRRDKTRALKQAMMQELLTGRIRLI